MLRQIDQIELGDEVKDVVTGFQGIAVARTMWLHGCARVTVQPKGTDKNGKRYENDTFDEPQLEIVKKKKVEMGTAKTGGPMPSPREKETIKSKN